MSKKKIQPKIIAQPPSATITKKPDAVILFFNRFENQVLWHWIVLILLPFFVYIKTVSYLLINMDDVAIIVNNIDVLTHIKNIGLAFKTDAFISAHGDFYRPMQTVSFMLDALLGGERPWIYHLSNLVYHILTVLSLYSLLRLLNLKNLPALFACLIFSVHPLLASSVSWVPARGDVLIGLFGVLSFITFIKYNDRGRIIQLVLHAALFLLALFSKETAILLPILFLFHHFVVRKNKLSKDSLQKLAPFFIIWIAGFILFYFLRSKVVTGNTPDFIFGIKPFFQNLAAIPTMTGKFFLPVRLSTMPLFEPLTTGIGVVLLIAVTWFVMRCVMKKNWLVVMGFAWFLLFVIPPMFFKLYYSKFLIEYYEHRSYLPIAGLILILAIVLDRAKRTRLFIWLPLTCIIIFSFIASAHSDHFHDSLTFFTNATELGNPGAAVKRGEFYMEQRDYQNAMNDFNAGIDLSANEYAPAFYNRGIVTSTTTKDHQAAEADFTRTIEIDTSYIEAYLKRAGERVFMSNFVGALSDVEKAKQLDSSNAGVYYSKAKVLTSAMNFEKALPEYSKAISMDSGNAELFNDRAYVRYRLHDFENALRDCNKAIGLFPQFLNAYYNKGMIYLELGKPQVAIKTFDTTLALADNFYFGYFYRGMAKKQVNDMKGACYDWNQSVKLGFTMAQDTINRYCK